MNSSRRSVHFSFQKWWPTLKILRLIFCEFRRNRFVSKDKTLELCTKWTWMKLISWKNRTPLRFIIMIKKRANRQALVGSNWAPLRGSKPQLWAGYQVCIFNCRYATPRQAQLRTIFWLIFFPLFPLHRRTGQWPPITWISRKDFFSRCSFGGERSRNFLDSEASCQRAKIGPNLVN